MLNHLCYFFFFFKQKGPYMKIKNVYIMLWAHTYIVILVIWQH